MEPYDINEIDQLIERIHQASLSFFVKHTIGTLGNYSWKHEKLRHFYNATQIQLTDLKDLRNQLKQNK